MWTVFSYIFTEFLWAVLWIRRDADPDSALCQWILRCQPKIKFFSTFLCLLLFKGLQTKKVIKNVKIMFFFTVFAWFWKDPDPGGRKTYESYGAVGDLLDTACSRSSLRPPLLAILEIVGSHCCCISRQVGCVVGTKHVHTYIRRISQCLSPGPNRDPPPPPTPSPASVSLHEPKVRRGHYTLAWGEGGVPIPTTG